MQLSFTAILLCLCLMLSGCSRRSETEIVPVSEVRLAETELNLQADFQETSADAEASGEEPEVSEESDATLYVHICGAVCREGVYELPAGSRVFDAVAAADGFAADADRTYVNEAAPVADGQQIVIPTVSEVETMRDGETAQISRTGEVMPTGFDAKDAGSATVSDGKIDLNTADEALLCTISGIGESRARDIIAYRTDHGRFQTIEDLKNVSGIGEKTFEKIRDRISVGERGNNGQKGTGGG